MHHHRLAPKSILAVCLLAALLPGCAGPGSAGKDAVPALAPAVAPAAKAADPAAKPLSAEALKEVVARVNGKEISRGELERSKKILVAGQKGMQVPPYMLKEFEKQALDQLINAELLYQAGEKLEVKDLDRDADAKLAQIKAGFKDQQSYARELDSINMTEGMLREYSRRDLVIANFVRTKLAADLKVTGDEVKKFYDDNPDKFMQQEQVRASHILVGVDAKADAQQKQQAREKAEKLQAQAAAGADFAQLAKENSTCPSSRNGGDLGYFGKGKMVPAFEQAAFALKPGEVSGVVETGYGFHVVKQLDRIKEEKVSLDTAREKIESYLLALKTNQAMATFVGEARGSAKIELLLK